MESTSLSSGNTGNFLVGAIPSGIFSTKVWAEIFDVDDGTFRKWMKKYEIPFFKPGDTMYVETGDLLKRIPYHNREDE